MSVENKTPEDKIKELKKAIEECGFKVKDNGNDENREIEISE